MTSFKPDWSEIWTAKQAEKELIGFKFNGPGWYRAHNIRLPEGRPDIILVIPFDRAVGNRWTMGIADTFWAQANGEEERFEFNVYSGSHPVDMFNAIIHAPTRFAGEF